MPESTIGDSEEPLGSLIVSFRETSVQDPSSRGKNPLAVMVVNKEERANEQRARSSNKNC